MKKNAAKVAIIMGSDSDFPVMKDAALALKEFNIPFTMEVVSAHRTPEKMVQFAKAAQSKGIQVIIAGAGGAAHLPGMVAASSALPVIGVPIPFGTLQGQDALLSIVQMPKGVPVATVAIGNAYNAGLLALQILASGGQVSNKSLIKKITDFKSKLKKKVLSKKLPKI